MSNTSFLNQCMTVAKLRQALEDYNDDDKVVFAYNYGDYQRTTVCAAVHNIGDGDIKYSEYHRMGKLIECTDEDEEPAKDPEAVSVVVLNIA